MLPVFTNSKMLAPLHDTKWNRTLAAHLLNRAGFGGTPGEIDTFVAMGPSGAVDHFLNARAEEDLFPPPPLVRPEERFAFRQREKAALTDPERRDIRKELADADRPSMPALRLWWLERMRYTSAPLVEKMTLFWHGLFATSNQKVNDPYMMWVQNALFRSHALGNFPGLLKAVSRDPAMIRWLDLGQSRRDHPNENFARELMELFSLGEGNGYNEKDVQEAARAFTGYRILPENGTFVFRPREFDAAPKTFFGKTAPFDGDGIIDAITARRECARFLAKRIWTFFVSYDPPEEHLAAVGDLLLSNGYDLGATLGTVFRSAAFYAPGVIHHQIKGPVQWMIQTTRMLDIPLPEQRVLESSLSTLGQVLFAPPNVKGWDGGRAWISASSLLYRYNLATYLLSGKARILGGGGKTVSVPLETIAPPPERSEAGTLVDHLSFRVFNVPLQSKEWGEYLLFLNRQKMPYSDNTVRDLLQIMMGTPEYQLN